MKIFIKYIFIILGLLLPISLVAQKFEQRDLIIKTGKSNHEGRIRLLSIENLYETTVEISLINEYDKGKKTIKLKKGETYKDDITLNVIKAKAADSQNEVEVLRQGTPDKTENKDNKKAVTQQEKAMIDETQVATEKVSHGSKVSVIKAIDDFRIYVDSINALSEEKRIKDSVSIAKHIEILGIASNDKNAYIEDMNLKVFITGYCDSLQMLRERIPSIITEYYKCNNLEKANLSEECREEIGNILEKRIEEFEFQIKPLKTIVEDSLKDNYRFDWKMIAIVVGSILICVLLIVWYCWVKRNQETHTFGKSDRKKCDDTPGIIPITKSTEPSLRKQNLDDVYDNAAYLKIDTNDFCTDSGVRSLYIKNSCIKEIYNMYANDLRNPDNPKEDGCMVLGRWVKDEKSQLYDVSLEYTVLPDDDAIFSEYELNFGGKIKLKISAKLGKLRRETGLQYDLTCWVHSHPGLGIFFSNSDNNVHMQLKHSSHPLFLTALVVDILTPKQDMGIFTFKQDEEVNSKNDLTKMYSLEEMYRWALESTRRSFDQNNYYNTLKGVAELNDACYGIQLSNGAIIDMTFLSSNSNGFMGFVQGYVIENNKKRHCIAAAVSKMESVANNEKIGCFVVASHCSIPSIRKVVANYLNDIHFVLVYTASDGLLTSIPVIDQDMCASDEFYGEQKLEDLAIWTRRKR